MFAVGSTGGPLVGIADSFTVRCGTGPAVAGFPPIVVADAGAVVGASWHRLGGEQAEADDKGEVPALHAMALGNLCQASAEPAELGTELPHGVKITGLVRLGEGSSHLDQGDRVVSRQGGIPVSR